MSGEHNGNGKHSELMVLESGSPDGRASASRLRESTLTLWENEREPEAPMEILLVEDNPGDVRLVDEALRECVGRYSLRVALDGLDAMALFEGRNRYGRSGTRPHLILLDLKLPRRDGRQVLSDIKSDDRLGEIPVVVLSSSRDDGDVATAYELGANCYVVKPADLERFVTVLRSIVYFWWLVATLPRR
jgi:CheY-like chemotaxis protein